MPRSSRRSVRKYYKKRTKKRSFKKRSFKKRYTKKRYTKKMYTKKRKYRNYRRRRQVWRGGHITYIPYTPDMEHRIEQLFLKAGEHGAEQAYGIAMMKADGESNEDIRAYANLDILKPAEINEIYRELQYLNKYIEFRNTGIDNEQAIENEISFRKKNKFIGNFTVYHIVNSILKSMNFSSS
jgi:hypothetical protein